MHPSLVEKLVYLCINYGGHENETKLTKLFSEMKVTLYVRQENTGSDAIVLVDYDKFLNERLQKSLPTNDIKLMKFHSKTLAHFMELYKSYGGHLHEAKLKKAYFALDFTPYESKTTGENYVVLTKDFINSLKQS